MLARFYSPGKQCRIALTSLLGDGEYLTRL
jgi:hypothetical protein